jgi:hypothetical protein
MPPVVLPPGYCAVTARVNVIVNQLGGSSQPGVAPSEGYRVEVSPWVVAPDPAPCPPPCPPPNTYIIVTIEWAFQAGTGVNFSEFGLDFKTKQHFQGVPDINPGLGEHYVETRTVPPAPPAGEIIALHLIDPMSLNAQDYEYIVNIELDNGLKIELDPGYRVRP